MTNDARTQSRLVTERFLTGCGLGLGTDGLGILSQYGNNTIITENNLVAAVCRSVAGTRIDTLPPYS